MYVHPSGISSTTESSEFSAIHPENIDKKINKIIVKLFLTLICAKNYTILKFHAIFNLEISLQSFLH